ncbi:hypothetical protein JCM11641_006814 [Rhodosporidiobolus odoratus]
MDRSPAAPPMRPSNGNTPKRLAVLRHLVFPAHPSEDIDKAVEGCFQALRHRAHPDLPLNEVYDLTESLVEARQVAHNRQRWALLRVPYRSDCDWWGQLQEPEPKVGEEDVHVPVELRSCQTAVVNEIDEVAHSITQNLAVGETLAKSTAVIKSCISDAPAFLSWLVKNGEPLPYADLRKAVGRCVTQVQPDGSSLSRVDPSAITTLRLQLIDLNRLTESEWSKLNSIDVSNGAPERHQAYGARSRQDVIVQQLDTIAKEARSLSTADVVNPFPAQSLNVLPARTDLWHYVG